MAEASPPRRDGGGDPVLNHLVGLRGRDALNGTVSRLRRTILILVFILVFGAVAAPVGVIVLVNQSQQRIQNEINCTTLAAGLVELQAIHRNSVILVRIAHSLGLFVEFPPPIEIPEVPPECVGV